MILLSENNCEDYDKRRRMKRFILCSLSATMAVALGSVARAAETPTTSEAQIDRNLLAQSIEDSYGSEGEVHQFEYRSPDLVGGILAPNDQGPNNRAIPATRASHFTENRMQGDDLRRSDAMTDQDDGYPTEGTIVAPDDQSPYNRAEPTPNPASESPMEMNNQADEGDYPTEGTIVAPDDQSPYNRAEPTPGRVDGSEVEMDNQMNEGDYPTENTILAPNSQDPYNRANPTPNR
jgi:hypothetical protein